MGGKSTSTQTSSSTTAPWEPAQPALKGILDQLNTLVPQAGLSPASSGAITELQANAQQGNPFASQITALTNNLFGGGGADAQSGNLTAALDEYRARLDPYASGSMVGNNPALKAQLDTIMSDVGNSINAQFAAAGRDMSGANQQAYGRGVAQGIAPVLANQYNQDVANQINAAGSLYGAGNTTAGLLSGLNQLGLSNAQAGAGMVPTVLEAQNYGPMQTLNLEQLKQSIPAQNLGLLAQIGIPIAGLGGTQSGQTTGTQKMSGAQQFATIAGGLNNFGKFLWG